MTLLKRTLFITVSAAMLSFSNVADIDYRQVFGSDYSWAVKWLTGNEMLLKKYAVKYGIPVKELKAIVFPELIRYNGVFDAMEIESLKFLYVTEGKEYADFSVGYFQMKPSFAEMLEAEAAEMLAFKCGGDNESSRRERVRRLTSTEHQLAYLCAFYKICESRFPVAKTANAEERVRLFATAYNSGYRMDIEKLRVMQQRRYFKGYNYADISAFFFRNE